MAAEISVPYPGMTDSDDEAHAPWTESPLDAFRGASTVKPRRPKAMRGPNPCPGPKDLPANKQPRGTRRRKDAQKIRVTPGPVEVAFW